MKLKKELEVGDTFAFPGKENKFEVISIENNKITICVIERIKVTYKVDDLNYLLNEDIIILVPNSN